MSVGLIEQWLMPVCRCRVLNDRSRNERNHAPSHCQSQGATQHFRSADHGRLLDAVSAEACADLGRASTDIARTSAKVIGFQKINYLALRMVDPNVHFHVIPRYSKPPQFDSTTHPGTTWPKLPDVTAALALTPGKMAALHARLHAAWP